MATKQAGVFKTEAVCPCCHNRAEVYHDGTNWHIYPHPRRVFGQGMKACGGNHQTVDESAVMFITAPQFA